MERMLPVFATIIAGFLLPVGPSRAEVRCEELRLKPIRCVCGTVIDEMDEVVSGATVTVLKDGTEMAAVKTGVDGKFSFNGLKAARYELKVRAVGYRFFDFPIIVQNAAKKCKQVLEITLPAGGLETCTSIRLVNR
jgi:hypothetical protein